MENIIYIQCGIKELWSGQDMNMHTVRRTGRQTDSQGDSYITPYTLFAVGIISKLIYIYVIFNLF